MSVLAKHVIHQPKPVRRFVVAVLTVLFVCTSVWLYISYTNQHLQSELRALKQQNQTLITDNQLLAAEYHRLSEQLLEQDQHLAIQNETDQELRQQFNLLQNDLIDLNRELAFYHNITQGSASSELQVRELQLIPDRSNKQRINYRLVLSQGKKITKPLTGSVSLALTAQKGNQSIDLPIAKHAFKLRHVQVITGHIDLQKETRPQAVTVTLKQAKKKSQSQQFAWKITDDRI